MDLEDVKKLNITKTPGCYQFKNKEGVIIYIGKAADLRSRVLSYWRQSANHSPAKYSMMKQIKSVSLVETDSEVEALLLEANLIKKYQPVYNIALRDDKRYIYVKVSTEEEWPRVFMTRKLDKSGRYFGPFASVEAVRQTLKIIRKIWPYRSCSKLPKKICLYYRLGRCQGMCEQKIGRQDYKKAVKQIILFLEGNKKRIIRSYELRIKNYEKKLKQKNINLEVKENINKELDILKFQLGNLKIVVGSSNVLTVAEKYVNDVVELTKVLGLPKIPERIEGYDISNIFGKQAVGSMVVFSGGEPDKSQYRKFKIREGEGEADDIRMLKEILERRFIKNKPRPDPLLTKEREIKEKWPLPDLIIIDGGRAQINIALKTLKKFSLNLPVIAISKGDGLRSAKAPDKIFFPGEKKPLVLPLASPALHIIKRVRDEAHRFAISYHRLLRKKRMIK